jgi:hypothetical protein
VSEDALAGRHRPVAITSTAAIAARNRLTGSSSVSRHRASAIVVTFPDHHPVWEHKRLRHSQAFQGLDWVHGVHAHVFAVGHCRRAMTIRSLAADHRGVRQQGTVNPGSS